MPQLAGTELSLRSPAKEEFIGLAKYDAMVLAIGECHRVDEAKKIHDIAAALEKYSRQAKSFESELRAMDIRIRASKRAGELLAQMAKDGKRATVKDGASSRQKRLAKPTLADLGITKDQSSQWQQLAGIKPEEFEEQLPVRTGGRTSPGKIAKEHRKKTVKLDPAIERGRSLKSLALRLWGDVTDLPKVAGNEPLGDVVRAMDQHLLLDTMQAIPKLRSFLSQLEKELRHAKNRKNKKRQI